MPSLKENVFYSGLLKVSSLIFPLITFPYVARILGPDQLGKVSFVQSFIQIFVLVAALGIPNYGIREIAKLNADVVERSKLFLECLILKAGFTLLALAIYVFLVVNLNDFQLNRPFYIWGIFTILLSIFDINYLFTALENFKFISVRSLLIQLVSLVFVFLFIKTREDALKYFLIPVGATFITSFVNIRYALPLLNIRSFKIDLTSIRKHINPILFLSGIVVFSSLGSIIDKVLLGFLGDDIKAVGYYAPGEKINSVALAFTMLLAPVIMPRISFLFEKGKSGEINELISKSLSFSHLVGVPLMIGVFIIAPEAVIIIAGNEYVPSIAPLRIMSAAPLIAGFTTLFTLQVFIPLRKDKLLLWCMIGQTIVCLTLNAFLIPLMQQDGAALSRVLTELVTFILCYFTIRTFYDLTFPVKDIIKNIIITLPFIIFAFLARQVFEGALLRFSVIVISCAAYYYIMHAYVLKTPMIKSMYSFVKYSGSDDNQ